MTRRHTIVKETPKEVFERVTAHRQAVTADKAKRKKTRKAARLARRAGRS